MQGRIVFAPVSFLLNSVRTVCCDEDLLDAIQQHHLLYLRNVCRNRNAGCRSRPVRTRIAPPAKSTKHSQFCRVTTVWHHLSYQIDAWGNLQEGYTSRQVRTSNSTPAKKAKWCQNTRSPKCDAICGTSLYQRMHSNTAARNQTACIGRPSRRCSKKRIGLYFCHKRQAQNRTTALSLKIGTNKAIALSQNTDIRQSNHTVISIDINRETALWPKNRHHVEQKCCHRIVEQLFVLQYSGTYAAGHDKPAHETPMLWMQPSQV